MKFSNIGKPCNNDKTDYNDFNFLSSFFNECSAHVHEYFNEFKTTEVCSMIRKGTKVKWKWSNGYAEGKVKETHSKSITRTIKGNEVTRKGSEDNLALLIEQDEGNEVLKLQSEVERVD